MSYVWICFENWIHGQVKKAEDLVVAGWLILETGVLAHEWGIVMRSVRFALRIQVLFLCLLCTTFSTLCT